MHEDSSHSSQLEKVVEQATQLPPLSPNPVLHAHPLPLLLELVPQVVHSVEEHDTQRLKATLHSSQFPSEFILYPELQTHSDELLEFWVEFAGHETQEFPDEDTFVLVGQMQESALLGSLIAPVMQVPQTVPELQVAQRPGQAIH